MKKVLIRAGIAVLVVVLILAGVKFAGPKLENKQEISTTVLEEAILPASELVSVKYYYNDIGTYIDAVTVEIGGKGTKVPFTTDEIMFTYGGVISLGIDIEEVSFDIDEAAGTITCTIPEVIIVSHEDDEEKFQEYIIRNSIFTATTWGDYNAIKAQLKSEQEELVLDDEEIRSGVQESAKDTISSLLNGAGLAEEHTLIFKFK